MMPKFKSSISALPKRVSTESLNRGLILINNKLFGFSSSIPDVISADGVPDKFFKVFCIPFSDFVCFLINQILNAPVNSSQLDPYIVNDMLKTNPLFSSHFATMAQYGFEDLSNYFNILSQQIGLIETEEPAYYDSEAMIEYEAFLKNPTVFRNLMALVESTLAGIDKELLASGLETLGYFNLDFFLEGLLNLPYKNFSHSLLENAIGFDLFKPKYEFYRSVNPVLLFRHIRSKLKYGINNANKVNIENSILDLLFGMSNEQLHSVGLYGLAEFVNGFKIYCGVESIEDEVDSSLLDDDYRQAFFELLKSDFYIAYFYERGFTVDLFDHLDSSTYKGEGVYRLSADKIEEESVLALLRARPSLISSFMMSIDFSRMLKAGEVLLLTDFIVDFYKCEFAKKLPEVDADALADSLAIHFHAGSHSILNTYLKYLNKILSMNFSRSMLDFLRFVLGEYQYNKSSAKTLRRILCLFAQLDSSYDIDKVLSEVFTINVNTVPALARLQSNAPVLTQFLHRFEYIIVEKDLRKVSVMGTREQIATVIEQLVIMHNKMLVSVHNLIHSAYQFVVNSPSVSFNSQMFKVLINALLDQGMIDIKSSEIMKASQSVIIKTSSREMVGLTNYTWSYITSSYLPSPTCLSIHEGLFRFCILPFIVEPDVSLLRITKLVSFKEFPLIARAFVQMVHSQELNSDVLLINPVYSNSSFLNISQLFMTWVLKFVEQFQTPAIVGCFENSTQSEYLNAHFSSFYTTLELTHRNYFTGYQWSEFAPGNIVRFKGRSAGECFSTQDISVSGYLFKPV